MTVSGPAQAFGERDQHGTFSAEEYKRILSEIDRLEEVSTQSAMEAEQILSGVLEPLLEKEGFDLRPRGLPGQRDYGIDFRGTRGDEAAGTAEAIGVEAKFYSKRRDVPLNAVHALIGAGLTQDISRVILVSNCDFSGAAKAAVEQNLPITVELKTVNDLRGWLDVLQAAEEEADVGAEVRIILKAVSEHFARLIARDAGTLAHLEWRDVERTIAEVFDGLGFRVTLTPGSKDGGKDVVLECEVAGKRAVYYVEIKHWRSATRVGADAVEKLLKVVVREKKDGGLFLSTYGFTDNAFEQLTTIDKQRLRFGDQDRIVTLCRTYVRAKSGIWSPPENLTEVLFD